MEKNREGRKMKLTFDVPEEMAEKIGEEIKAALEKYKEKQSWPQMGDKYWYIKFNNTIGCTEWDNMTEEFQMLEIGNVFRTQEEAEFKTEQLKVLHELEQLADDDQIDAYKNYHYILIYDFDEFAVKIDDIVCAGFMYGTHYFKSKESAQAAIDKIGEDRLKKYYFCIPEE